MHLVFADGAAEWELAVDIRDPGARVRDLVVALGAAPGSRARLLADGRPVGLDVELADAGIVDGATIQIATSERGAPRPASAPPMELAVVGGLDAGRRHALASERTVVGRDIDDGVALRHATVSREHAAFTVHASGAVTATDLGSRNGTWRRGQALRGDVAVDPHDVLRLGAVQVVARSARREDRARRATTLAGLAAVVPFNRPPRPAAPGARAPLDVPEPPKPAAARGPFSIVAVLAPLLMAAVMVKVLGNPAFALFALLSPVMLLGSAVEQRRQRKRSTRREAGRYASDLARFASTFDAAIADELDHRRRALPDLAEVARRATLPSVQLWQRRTPHDDWLQLRAGIGDIVWRPPLAERSGARPTELDALLVDRSVLVDAPVDVDLSAGGIVGLVGGRDASLAVARALVVQAAVHHGPADLTIAVLVAAEAHAAWDWAKWLPHTRAHDGDGRLLAADPDGASAIAEAVLARGAECAGPTVLAVIDDERLTEGRRSPVRAVLAGKGGPVAGIVLASTADRLPSVCRTIIELRGSDGDAVLHRPLDGDAPQRLLAAGLADDVARPIARALARHDDPEVDIPGAGLPDSLPLLGLLGLDAPDRVSALAARWHALGCDPAPVAPIGLSTDDVCAIDVARDGPHALIAGTTGSGKSELLRTFVAGLAASSSPEHLTFVLVDFKGGSAFDACARLPHTVGLVTDLDEHLAERALRCLEAELRHRERLLRAHAAADLGAYRRAPDEASRPPLPRLVVVIDEFATLKAELPDFVDSLVGVAQRGRSLGVHLVLATQRPAGAVSENIKANTNLRICLRVQDGADSSDVIGTPVAGTLPRHRPGRAIVRLGPGELVPIQTALATGPADAGGAPVVVEPFAFGPGERAARPTPGATGRTELDLLVEAAVEAFRASGAAPPRRPWPEPVAREIDLEELCAADRPSGELWVPFGVADDPDRQCHEVHGWCPEQGNLVLWGIGGSGTTTALASIALSLATRRTAEQVHLYVVDGGAGELGPLVGLPHCGAVIGPGERERQVRLVRMLRAELNRRRALGRAAVRSLPAVVVLIDGYAAFAAEHGDAAGLSVLDDVARVFADGTGVGIHLAVAADRIGALPMALVALARQRLLLQLADPHDYAIAGVSARSLPTFSPGRAVDAVTGREVQIARSRVALRDAVATIAAARPAPMRAPAGVGVLPQAVDVAAIGAAQLGSRPWRLPVGLGERALAPAGFSLFGGEHALVAGPGRSGRSTTLRVISQVACEADALVVTVAGPRSPLRATYGPGDAHRAAAEVLASDRPAILLVDDAELVDDPSGALAGLVEGHDPRVAVIAAGRADVLRSAYTHWTRAIRRSKAGLLLQPNVDLDGELVGVTLPRRAPVALGAGRGWLVSGADLDVVQVAT